MNIEIVPAARRRQSCVEELMQFYFYDMTSWAPLAFTPEGRFQTPCVEAYFTRPDHHPFLVRVDGDLAGFALVNNVVTSPESDHNMGQFFIARRHQRRGVGRHVAMEVFDRFPGAWEVYQVRENERAIEFWRCVVGAYTGGEYQEAPVRIRDVACVQQRFRTRVPSCGS